MSRTTKEINRVTGAIIRISLRLIVYGAVLLLLYEGVSRGYEFGHSLFYETAAAEEPGVDMRVTIGENETLGDIAAALERGGLIKSRYAFLVQSLFYGYGGSGAGGDLPAEQFHDGKGHHPHSAGWHYGGSDGGSGAGRGMRSLEDCGRENPGLYLFAGARTGRTV